MIPFVSVRENEKWESLVIYHWAFLLLMSQTKCICICNFKGCNAMNDFLKKFKDSPITTRFDLIQSDCKDPVLNRKIRQLLKGSNLNSESKIKIQLKTTKHFDGKIQVLKYLHNEDMGHYLESEIFLQAKIEDNYLVVG